MNNKSFWRVVYRGGEYLAIPAYDTAYDHTPYIRPDMLRLAGDTGEIIQYDKSTRRCKRIPGSTNNVYIEPEPDEHIETIKHMAKEATIDPTISFINNCIDLKPKELIITDLKWKYLIRSAMRGRNIMMTGPSGCGKTLAAQQLVKALNRPFFYVNLGATQDPRGALIGNTHFEKETGTVFHQSAFVKAIQTPNSIILLDEISRAHPEAWNILMTVLDYGQRYLRLDEHPDTPIINVADNVTFIATANIGNEYTATRSMDRALLDRFIILEMELLSKDDEYNLLINSHPGLSAKAATDITEIAYLTRREKSSSTGKLTNSVSTRLSMEMAGLMLDGFNLADAAEVCIYPFFDNDGGVDSERTYVRQLVQKFIPKETTGLFN
jgi:MoxR-like ATPase